MTSSKIFFYLCLSFIGGIFLSSFFIISQLFRLGFLIFGMILISAFWKHKKLVVLGFCILFLVFGIWRYQFILSKIKNDELKKYNDLEQQITLTGFVSSEPDVKEKSTKLLVEVENLNGRKLKGKVLVTIRKYPKYQYGDKLRISGKLETPKIFEGFNYKNYLLKEGVYSVMDFPEIELIGGNFGNPIMKFIFLLKSQLKESLNSLISPPQSGLLEALFFGDEENISKIWKEKFNLTGTSHITAVSGMNITILSSLILNFLLFFGLYRLQAFYFSIILIFLYVLMIGAPASAIRAGLMGILFLTAQNFGRVSSASRIITFVAVLMIFLNPLLLRFDVGFQLSFLAMLGLIYLQPIFLDLFKKIPNVFQLRYTLSSTLAAQFFTLPILIYNFGQISLISPLTNILIVPLLPITTIFGFAFSFLGIVFQPLGQILSWPSWLILTYILKIIDLSSKIPFAVLILKDVSWIWLIISYLILGFITGRLNERQRLKFLNY